MYYTEGYCSHLNIQEQLLSKISHLQNLQITLNFLLLLFKFRSEDMAEPS